MNRLMQVSRMLAILIGIVAIIDPTVTSNRRSRPQIALVAAPGSARAELADRVTRELSGDYAVIRGAYAGAAATILVDHALPANASELASPVFAVRSTPRNMVIESVDVPAHAAVESRVPVGASLRTRSAGDTVDVTLSVGGVVVDRGSSVAGAGGRARGQLSFAPPGAGVWPLRVVARSRRSADSSIADLTVSATDDRWAVLFFDRRPSWLSTFTRRSLENDRRFAVVSRVMTSRGVSTAVGSPPSSLEDPTLLELYDAIIIGAPDALTARDVAALDRFLRRRGGGVVLLFDKLPTGGAYDRLTGVARWGGSATTTASLVVPTSTDSADLRATELSWPATAPLVSVPLATSVSGGVPEARAIVWSTPVGAGELIVNGALDAWKFRDPAASGFDRFWRTTIARAAERAMPAIEASVAPRVATPGELITVRVSVRDARLAAASDRARASVEAVRGDGPSAGEVRMWPTDNVGELQGQFRAPVEAGTFRLVVRANGGRVELPIVVVDSAVRGSSDQPDIVDAFTRSRGGRIVDIAEVIQALRSAVRAERRVVEWHPMRNEWWIVPFVLLLGAEWWWRRRQGLA